MVVGAVSVTPAEYLEIPTADVAVNWRARVLSEDAADWGLVYAYAAWRRFLVVQEGDPLVLPIADPDDLTFEDGLPVDIVSLSQLQLATGFPLDAQTATELARLRAVATRMVCDRAPAATPDLIVGAICRLVGYLHERPVGSEAAWRGSGASQILQDSIGD